MSRTKPISSFSFLMIEQNITYTNHINQDLVKHVEHLFKESVSKIYIEDNVLASSLIIYIYIYILFNIV